MKKSGARIRRFLLDTNVFVSALKKRGKALELLVELLDKKYELVGNKFLLGEYLRYSDKLPSDVARFLLTELAAKMRIVEPSPKLIKICRPYFPLGEAVDIVLAATCLQEEAILISNDKHFDRIKREGIIDVWSISDAIKKILK